MLKILHSLNNNENLIFRFKKQFTVQKLFSLVSLTSNLYTTLYLSELSFKKELNFNFTSHSHIILLFI